MMISLLLTRIVRMTSPEVLAGLAAFRWPSAITAPSRSLPGGWRQAVLHPQREQVAVVIPPLPEAPPVREQLGVGETVVAEEKVPSWEMIAQRERKMPRSRSPL